jgi:hypothetical protein
MELHQVSIMQVTEGGSAGKIAHKESAEHQYMICLSKRGLGKV